MEEVNKYHNGKIYKIISDHSDKIYIGSTYEPTLARRLAKHKEVYKSYCNNKYHFVTSFELLKLGDVSIILLENYKCNSKDELTARERYYIELNKDITVNKVIPTRTKKEYHNDNKEHFKEYDKKYYNDNKDIILNRCSEYYNNNIEYITQRNSIKINCECGGYYSYQNKKRHINSKKHLKFINKE